MGCVLLCSQCHTHRYVVFTGHLLDASSLRGRQAKRRNCNRLAAHRERRPISVRRRAAHVLDWLFHLPPGAQAAGTPLELDQCR